MLTDLEHKAMDQTAELSNTLSQVVGNDPVAREQDMRELVAHIHAIQRAIMAQSAAREHPHDYRLLGERIASTQT